MKQIILITLCVQMAQDTATRLFNCERVRSESTNRKADILMTNDSFRKMFSDIRRNLEPSEWEDYLQKLDDKCYRYEHVTSGIYNYYHSQCVLKYRYEDCEMLALCMTTLCMLHTAQSLFVKLFNGNCKYIERIVECVDGFTNHWRVSGFVGVSTQIQNMGVRSILSNFIKTALNEQ